MTIHLKPLVAKFNKLDIKARYGVFGVLLALLVLLDVFVVMGFQRGALDSLSLGNQTLKTDIERLKNDLLRIDQMKTSLLQSRTQLEAMNMKIRGVTEVSPVLEDVSRMAQTAGVKIEQLTPQAELGQPLITTSSIKYYALPIVVQASSGYHMFGRFMSELESAKLFFNLSHFSIQTQENDRQQRSISAVFKVVLSDTESKP